MIRGEFFVQLAIPYRKFKNTVEIMAHHTMGVRIDWNVNVVIKEWKY